MNLTGITLSERHKLLANESEIIIGFSSSHPKLALNQLYTLRANPFCESSITGFHLSSISMNGLSQLLSCQIQSWYPGLYEKPNLIEPTGASGSALCLMILICLPTIEYCISGYVARMKNVMHLIILSIFERFCLMFNTSYNERCNLLIWMSGSMLLNGNNNTTSSGPILMIFAPSCEMNITPVNPNGISILMLASRSPCSMNEYFNEAESTESNTSSKLENGPFEYTMSFSHLQTIGLIRCII